MKSILQILKSREAGLAGLVVLMVLVLSVFFPAFGTRENLFGVFDDTSILILLALGEMLVLLTGGVDLSVASIIALAGMCSALFNHHHPGAGLLPALLLAVAVGVAAGAVNGLLVWRLSVPPIVATLGTMSVFRGCVFLLSGGAWINSSQMSAEFLDFARGSNQGLSHFSWLALAAVALAWLLLRRFTLGRNLYAAGSNAHAAGYVGVDVGRAQFWAFTLCGAVAGLCGYLWVSRFGVAYTDVALGFELQVIAACVIGGVAITGGAGTVAGVLLGSLFLGVIKNALPLAGVSPFWQMAISGIVITVAVVINARSRRAAPRRILEGAAP